MDWLTRIPLRVWFALLLLLGVSWIMGQLKLLLMLDMEALILVP